MSRTFEMPPAPLGLTVAGLAPFAGGAVAIALLREDAASAAYAAFVLMAYAAVILSFLGGSRWGGETVDAHLSPPRASILGASVLPSLAGWGLVAVWPLTGGWPELLLAAAILIGLQGLWDLSPNRFPQWYKGLRLIATAGAVAFLLLGWAAYRFLAAPAV